MVFCLTAVASGCHSGYTPSRLTRLYQRDILITFPAAGSLYLVWTDDDNVSQTMVLNPDSTPDGTSDSTAGTSSVVIPLSSDVATPVSVYYAGQEHPLGCVYPEDTVCTAAGGWAAHILSQFLKKTPGPQVRQYASTFNWQRLTTAAARLEDPWVLDEETILTAIHQGTFDSSLVRQPKNR